jgi:hypothetical protein
MRLPVNPACNCFVCLPIRQIKRWLRHALSRVGKVDARAIRHANCLP